MERVGIIPKTTTHKGEQMIPKGYKHTELGVLPEDWEVVRLGDIGKIVGGGTPSTKKVEFWSGTIPWISSSDIDENSVFDISQTRYITQEAISKSSTKPIEPNSILIVSRVGLGKVAVNQNVLCTSQDIQALTQHKQNAFFLVYAIKNLVSLACRINQGTSIKGFTKEVLSNLCIPLPPLAEQEKIAEILSTWDTQIQNFESLIAEKQALKKGLCQTLLTAKTRLKGFSGDWEVARLGDILEYEQPTKYLVSNTKYDNSYTTPVLTAGKTFILGYTDEVEGIYTNLPIILFDDFTTASQYVDFPFKVKSSACKILKLKNTEFSLRVVFEVMQRLNFVADDHKRYWISEYQNQEIFLPNAKEQRGIAEILSEADNEITLLEQKLESLKSQKKGLMQKLLNGKIGVK